MQSIPDYPKAIAASQLTIYDPIAVGSELWIPTPVLEQVLDKALSGLDVAGLPLRTRSKFVKGRICAALGYQEPKSFRKTQPRFPGQNFDAYTQKADNLQVWNEELSPNRRYVLLRPDANGTITRVKVATGQELAVLDTTKKLTRKYQARIVLKGEPAELVSESDTDNLLHLVGDQSTVSFECTPTKIPEAGTLLPIGEMFARLRQLIGSRFADAGHDQERNRGAALHALVCKALGYSDYRDDGQFPDILHQLCEVKLQTSQTIDLGLVIPSSTAAIDSLVLNGRQIRHCDVRYAVFYATTDGKEVTLTHLFLATGEEFFERFEQFQGLVQNEKYQIHLPQNFFARETECSPD